VNSQICIDVNIKSIDMNINQSNMNRCDYKKLIDVNSQTCIDVDIKSIDVNINQSNLNRCEHKNESMWIVKFASM